MLSICPSFNAAPLTLQRVLTMRSALASDRKGLESKTAFLLSPACDETVFYSEDKVNMQRLHLYQILNLTNIIISQSPQA